MTYRAPVRDIRFCLEEIAALDGLKPTGAFPELSGDLTGAILEEAARLANDVLAPLNWTGDQQGCTLKDGKVTTPDGFKDAYGKFVEGSWQGLQFAAEHGGMGLPRALGCALMEMLQSANMAFGLGPMLSFWRYRGADRGGHARAARGVSAENHFRRMDSDHESDRAAGGFGCGGAAHQGRTQWRRFLVDHRTENLYHLGRARLHGQYHPPGAGAHARRRAGHARHLALPRAQIHPR